MRRQSEYIGLVTSHTGCVSRNFVYFLFPRHCRRSHPTRDVWVEIYKSLYDVPFFMSHPTRDVWVEIMSARVAEKEGVTSHPTRDVWVEIYVLRWKGWENDVTSHTGCVSRNVNSTQIHSNNYVTSHTGCVSRNRTSCRCSCLYAVTSHTGCVSRNDLLSTVSNVIRVTSHTGCVSRNH